MEWTAEKQTPENSEDRWLVWCFPTSSHVPGQDLHQCYNEGGGAENKLVISSRQSAMLSCQEGIYGVLNVSEPN